MPYIPSFVERVATFQLVGCICTLVSFPCSTEHKKIWPSCQASYSFSVLIESEKPYALLCAPERMLLFLHCRCFGTSVIHVLSRISKHLHLLLSDFFPTTVWRLFNITVLTRGSVLHFVDVSQHQNISLLNFRLLLLSFFPRTDYSFSYYIISRYFRFSF